MGTRVLESMVWLYEEEGVECADPWYNKWHPREQLGLAFFAIDMVNWPCFISFLSDDAIHLMWMGNWTCRTYLMGARLVRGGLSPVHQGFSIWKFSLWPTAFPPKKGTWVEIIGWHWFLYLAQRSLEYKACDKIKKLLCCKLNWLQSEWIDEVQEFYIRLPGFS